jgi:hypothetical protein
VNPKHKDPKWVRQLRERGLDPEPWRRYKEGWPKAWKACVDLRTLVRVQVVCAKEPVVHAAVFAHQAWSYVMNPLQSTKFILDYNDHEVLRRQTQIYIQACNEGTRGSVRVSPEAFREIVKAFLRPVEAGHRYMFDDVRDVLYALDALHTAPRDYARYAHVLDQMSFLDGRRNPEAYRTLLERFAIQIHCTKPPVLS